MVFICLLFFLIISFSSKKTNPTFIETTVVSVVSSFQALLTHSVKNIENSLNHYIFLTQVQENNRRLKEEMKILKNKLQGFKEQKKAFERLSRILDYKFNSEREMLLASVIGADIMSWSKMITIDKGSEDGVKKNRAVVTYEGLVGHIAQTTPHYSKVLLISDVRSAVDAIDQNTRTRGVVVGKGRDIFEMKYISIDDDIQVGDQIISSGFGGIFPKGYIVGKVSKAEEIEKGLFKNVIVIPAVKVSLLEEVFVLN